MYEANSRSGLAIYIMTTDRGSNELLARKSWLVIAKDSPDVVVLLGDCLEHASHLVALQALKLADTLLKNHGVKFKYFSSLATSCNTFRDLAKGIYMSWCEIHGDLSGQKFAKKLWPKLVAGRWNACNDVEQRMEQVGGRSMMQPVFEKVMATKPQGQVDDLNDATADKTDKTSASNKVDDISFEETKQYQRQMGRWRKATKELVDNALWWVLAAAMKEARSPITHFSATRISSVCKSITDPVFHV